MSAPPPGSPHDDDPGPGTPPSDQASTLPEIPVFPPANPAGSLPLPFGRYELRQVLGGGGMATVYLAHDTLLDRDVALKIPHPDCLKNPVLRERFHREGRAAARLRHPNLCPVLDLGTHGDILYLTMPHIEGRRLSQYQLASPEEAARLVRTLARGMAEAHRHQVIHRDLKPDNVLITADGEPIITDFGVALLLDVEEPLTEPGMVVGTLRYMAPEQVDAQRDLLGVASDIFALGVILYRLLTDRLPFTASHPRELRRQILREDPTPPSELCPGLSPVLEGICLKALAKRPQDRFASMTDFADALSEYLELPRSDGDAPRPLVPAASVRFAFVGMGERAPDAAGPQDRLWLDVGNDLRPGVVDHHHLLVGAGSTASLVLAYPAFLDRSVVPSRRADAAFTLVLHDKPDLDAVASAFLAQSYLCTRAFPPGAESLVRYVDEVDEGVRGATQDNPCDLYVAFQQLAHRLLTRPSNTPQELWQELARSGIRLVDHVVAQATLHQRALPDVDAFTCPDLFDPSEREAITRDLERYRRKLADPRTGARQVRLRLPGQYGGTLEVEALLARDVQNLDDPERCVFFKDWARTDRARSVNRKGFEALCVFCAEGPRQLRRAILSVNPSSKASLRGLGALLDRAEAERRHQVYGADDRVVDPATGQRIVPRPGYDNADPWYDGRAHSYTIVDSPRGGTLLTAEEIEHVFLDFAGVRTEH